MLSEAKHLFAAGHKRFFGLRPQNDRDLGTSRESLRRFAPPPFKGEDFVGRDDPARQSRTVRIGAFYSGTGNPSPTAPLRRPQAATSPGGEAWGREDSSGKSALRMTKNYNSRR